MHLSRDQCVSRATKPPAASASGGDDPPTGLAATRIHARSKRTLWAASVEGCSAIEPTAHQFTQSLDSCTSMARQASAAGALLGQLRVHRRRPPGAIRELPSPEVS